MFVLMVLDKAGHLELLKTRLIMKERLLLKTSREVSGLHHNQNKFRGGRRSFRCLKWKVVPPGGSCTSTNYGTTGRELGSVAAGSDLGTWTHSECWRGRDFIKANLAVKGFFFLYKP